MEVNSTFLFSFGILVSFLWLPFFIFLVLLSLYKSTSDIRKAKRRLDLVEYEPPLDLTPAEIGMLYDNKVSAKKEILAAIISYLMTKNTSLGEKRLYESLIKPGASLKHEEIYTKIYGEYRLENNLVHGFTKTIKTELTKKKMLGNNKRYDFRTVKIVYIYVPLIFFFVDTLLSVFGLVEIDSKMESAFSEFIVMQAFGYFLYFLGATLGLIAYASFTNNFKNLTLKPKTRRGTWDEIRGYRYYLAATVQKARLEYLLNTTDEQLKQYDYLPYAVALGVIKPKTAHNLIERLE